MYISCISYLATQDSAMHAEGLDSRQITHSPSNDLKHARSVDAIVRSVVRMKENNRKLSAAGTIL